MNEALSLKKNCDTEWRYNVKNIAVRSIVFRVFLDSLILGSNLLFVYTLKILIVKL